MNDQIPILVEIQRLDISLDRLKQAVDDAPKQFLEIDQEISRLQEELKTATASVEDAAKKQRALESEVEEGKVKIAKSKNRLIDIKTNKEYRAVLKEIEDIQAGNAKLEDQILVSMEELELLRGRLKDIKRRVADACGDAQERKAELTAKVAESAQELNQVIEHRQRTAASIEPTLLQRYDRIRKFRDGIGVASVDNATCAGCNITIPPQVFNTIQRGISNDLFQCPSCDRIIYYKGCSHID